MRARAALTGLLVLVLGGVGCGASESAGDSREPAPSPWVSALPERPWESEPGWEARVELGRLLFYDPILGADGEVACATCHSEIWGMSDGVPKSIGVFGEGATGPGREGPETTQRNSQTLWNVAFRETLFWDGRATTLEEQVHFPMESPVELAKPAADSARDVAAVAGYEPYFEQAFGDSEVSEERIAWALSDFQRSLVSDRAPYDRFLAGDEGALHPDAVVGIEVFERHQCGTCHTPPLFESNQFVARGVGDADPGRFDATGDEADRGAFRVPTLRNLRETEPYFHDGSVATLEEAVEQELSQSGQPRRAGDLVALIELLRTGLMDRNREPHRPDEVPSGLPVPADGFRIIR